MLDDRTRRLVSEADAQQSARARLYQRLDQLVDMCDARTFVDVLLDVATLQARPGRSNGAREWGKLRDALEEFLKENPPARCACTGKGGEGAESAVRQP
jgi:hypothetical protein